MLTNDKCNDCEELARLHFQAQELIRKLNEVPVDDMDIRKSIVNKLFGHAGSNLRLHLPSVSYTHLTLPTNSRV